MDGNAAVIRLVIRSFIYLPPPREQRASETPDTAVLVIEPTSAYDYLLTAHTPRPIPILAVNRQSNHLPLASQRHIDILRCQGIGDRKRETGDTRVGCMYAVCMQTRPSWRIRVGGHTLHVRFR